MQRDQEAEQAASQVGHDALGLGLRVERTDDEIGLEADRPGSPTNGVLMIPCAG